MKQVGKGFAKAAAKKVDDFVIKNAKVCVFACFPKGTKIHTEKGQKSIEKIKKGDLVWSWDESTNQKALKKVVSTKKAKTDVIIELHTNNGEIIKTTPTHPFKTNEEWKDALDLKIGDTLKTFSDDTLKISKILHLPKNEEVFNFHVKDFHTYYIGENLILVHNACDKNVITLITRNMQLKGLVHKSGVKFVEETVEIGGKLIKGVFPKFNSKASLKMPKALWKKSRDDHFKYCTEFLKKEIKKNPDLAKKFTKKQLKDINQLKKQIDGLSWHHHQKEGVMQLVDKVIHAKTAHTGGFSLWGP